MNLKPCKNMKYFTNSVNGATHVVNAAEKFNNRNLIIQIMRVGFIYTALMLMSFQLLLAIPVRSQSISKVEVKLELRNESLLTAFKKIEKQLPLKPVCPVKKTFLFFQNFFKIKKLFLIPQCPWGFFRKP